MSNEIMGNTKAELLNWMKTGTKTLGWGALIAIDRATINNAFREQYVSSYSSNSYMAEINVPAQILDSNYKIFDQCVLSEPRLSFVDSKITNSSPVSNLEMEIIGGREIALDYHNDTDAVCKKIIQVNALNPTILAVKVPLEKKSEPGSVGAVVVDLGKGTSYDLSSSNSTIESTLSGASFKKTLAKWPPAKRIWKINDLVTNEGALSVEGFEIRCQPAPASNQRGAINYGEGAVVLFVQTTGTEPGIFPSTEAQLRYLVPSDGANPYTVVTIISSAALLTTTVVDAFGLDSSDWVKFPFQYNPAQLNPSRIQFTSGAVYRRYEWEYDGEWHYSMTSIREGKDYWEVTAGSNQCTAELYHETAANGGGQFVFDFKLTNYMEYGEIHRGAAAHDENIPITINGRAIGRASLMLDVDRQVIAVSPALGSVPVLNVEVGAYTAPVDRNKVQNSFVKISNEALQKVVKGFGSRSTNLSLLALNSLLLQGPYANRLSDLQTPYDMALFGHVAPTATAFEITTPLPVIGAGRPYTFAISGSNTGVTWSVDNLPGESIPKGSISASGVYTAPPREQINGVQTRVKVTARKGGASASALVTVVRKEININPLVQFVNPGSTCDLVAGSLGRTRTWSAVDPAKGSLRDSTTEGRDKTFVAPPTGTPGVFLDVVPITVTSEGVSETAYVCVTHNNTTLDVVAGTIDTAARTIKLKGQVAGMDVPDGEATWEVLAGSGTIDETGLLRVPAAPPEPFALVKCKAGFFSQGYLLLPLPLAPFPTRTELDDLIKDL